MSRAARRPVILGIHIFRGELMYRFSRQQAVALANVVAIAVCLLVVTGAAAKVIPTVHTTFGDLQIIPPTSATGETAYVTNPNSSLGAHTDYTVRIDFGYGATAMVGTPPYEDSATYPPPSDFRESVRDLIVDSPRGLIGNPNAVPFAERCDLSTFETSICPDSATIGTIAVETIVLPLGADEGGPTAPVQPGINRLRILLDAYNTEGHGGFTKLSLLKTDPEVPATIGVYAQPPFGFQAIRETFKISPDVNGDLKMRTQALNLGSVLRAGPLMANPGTPLANFRLDSQELRFFGRLPNGRAFMTSPTVCEKWATTVWANARRVNDNLDADPLGTGAPTVKLGNTDLVTPDCTNAASVPFPVAGKVAIDTPKRDVSPAFDFTIDNPGMQADGQASTGSKKIVTTIPASINVDVKQLGRVCSAESFKADTCPATSRVGSVKIATPIISAGLSGDAYLVKQNAASGLPDLGLRVRGAFSYTQLGSNRYVGEKFNQIETTFDNIPPVGFTRLTFHIDGGPNGLLRSLACPTFNKKPAVANFTYTFYAWTGATATSTTPLNMANCFGIQTLKKYRKCLHQMLPIHPNYQSRSRVKNVVLKIDGRRKASRKHSPFRFDLPIKKLKLKPRKRHTIELRATYDDKSLSKKRVTFKVCKPSRK